MVQIHRILDPDQNRWGQTMLKVPILGGDQLTARVAEECLRNLVIGSGNAGVSGAKRCPFEMVQAHGPEPLTVIKSACIHSPRAVIDKGVAIRQGIVIGESAIVGAGAAVVEYVPSRAVLVGVPAKFLWSIQGTGEI
jgi:hypothetical protein